MTPRYDARTDANQAEIVDVWSRCGFWVLDLSKAAATFSFVRREKRVHGGISDLLVWMGPVGAFVEVKAEGGRIEGSEEAFLSECAEHGVHGFIEFTLEDALRDALWLRNVAIAAQRGIRGR